MFAEAEINALLALFLMAVGLGIVWNACRLLPTCPRCRSRYLQFEVDRTTCRECGEQWIS